MSSSDPGTISLQHRFSIMDYLRHVFSSGLTFGSFVDTA